MDPEELAYGPSECGSCRWWRPILEDARGPIGPCRQRVRTGDFPGTAPACEKYLGRTDAIPAPAPPPEVRRAPVARPPAVHRASPSPLPVEILDMTREEFVQAIRDALRDDAPEVPLAPKWEGGTILVKPADPALQAKELPIDALFHKVIMVRDRLRVLEQKMNAHPRLSDAEKVEMQGYVTKCYGSLTSFNLLFRDERDKFVGDKT
jgi:hypothetical protein